MEFREKIENELKKLDNQIYYGKVPNSILEKDWNYIVFGKSKIKKPNKDSIDLYDYYWVTIVRENYIPDELVFNVIDSLNSLPGLRLTTEDGEYNYLFKGSTDLVVELVTLVFAKVKKCGNLCP